MVRVLLLLLVLVLVSGIAFVMLWDIPAPTQQIEVTVPDGRLPP